MLYHDAGLSFLHFIAVFILVGALSAELLLLRLPVGARVARLLLRADALYGMSALGLIVAGIARVTTGAKGWEFYAGQPFFWAKMAVFAAIGLISIAPTMTFFRWGKAVKADAAFVVSEAEVKRTKRLVAIEVHALALVVLFAVLMARGIGG